MPTFRNTLFHLHKQVGTHIYLPMKMKQSVPKRRHINSRHGAITKKKAYKMFMLLSHNQFGLPFAYVMLISCPSKIAYVFLVSLVRT